MTFEEKGTWIQAVMIFTVAVVYGSSCSGGRRTYRSRTLPIRR